MSQFLQTLALKVVEILGIVFAGFLTYVSGKDKGKTEQKEQQSKEDLEAAKERIKVNANVQKTNDPDLDERLSKWVRD